MSAVVNASYEQAQALGDELVAAGVLTWLPEPDAEGRTIALAVDLQENFALNQPLASFALQALELLGQESEPDPLDILSVVEAILDDPFPVLMAQANKAKGEAVADHEEPTASSTSNGWNCSKRSPIQSLSRKGCAKRLSPIARLIRG